MAELIADVHEQSVSSQHPQDGSCGWERGGCGWVGEGSAANRSGRLREMKQPTGAPAAIARESRGR